MTIASTIFDRPTPAADWCIGPLLMDSLRAFGVYQERFQVTEIYENVVYGCRAGGRILYFSSEAGVRPVG